MAITPLSTSLYASTLNGGTASGKSASGSSSSGTSSASIGKQLLAELAKSQASTGALSNSLLQDQVTLSAGTQGKTGSSALTYDAKGLLQQLRNNMLNDPLLQATDGSNTNSNAQQSLASLLPTTSTSGKNTGTTTDAQSQALAAITSGGDSSNIDWAQLMKQNPTLAGALMDSQSAQSMFSMLA